ncbi:MAG: aspartate aminotransferase family protein [Alphaproteobacteria bacterium]
MNYTANTLEQHWMPFTANREFKAYPRLLVRAEGVYYWNHRGEKILDGCSGLFCVAAGHGRPEIREAVARQLAEMDYTPPFQFGHPSSFELARRVAELTPEGLDHVFFTCSGSEAVDSALKIALAYHRARGEGQRFRFVGRERAYHGMNFGGTSVGGIGKNRDAAGPGLPGVLHLRHTWLPEQRFTKGQPEVGAELADDLQRMADYHGGDTIAACVVEPIAGSTGVLVPPEGYLERLREICDRHGILLIFDDVICAFGRIGRAFSAQSFGVVPDIITMAKALTNGCLPMGAVAVQDEIYETVTAAAPEGAIEFFHGYTYSGCPAAAAAGLAALDIYRQERLFERAAQLSAYFLDSVFSLKDVPVVTDIRGYGMLAGIDIAPAERPGVRGYQVLKRLFEAGLLVKATGDAFIVAPPLVAGEEHVDQISDTLRTALSRF